MNDGPKIGIVYRGPFGQQIVNNLAEKGLAGNIVYLYELTLKKIEQEHPSETGILSKIWEYPERYVPKSMPSGSCDLLLVLGIHPKLGDLVPKIAERLKAKAVLYPIDDQEHVPEAMKTIKDDLETKGIHCVFPEPFCLIEEEEGENDLVNYFAKHFGKPRFSIRLDTGKKAIKEIKVVRDTPCGSASCVAEKLLSTSYEDEESFAKKIFDEHNNEGNKNYCLASMDPIKPLMQEAGDILRESIYEACGFTSLEDVVMEEVRKSRDITINELKEVAIKQKKRCEAERTVERCVNRLVEQGRIVKIGKEDAKLRIA